MNKFVLAAVLLFTATNAQAFDNMRTQADYLFKAHTANLDTLARHDLDLQDMLTSGVCGVVNVNSLSATYVLCNQRELAKQVTYREKGR